MYVANITSRKIWKCLINIDNMANGNFPEPTKSLVQRLHGSYKCGLTRLKAVSKSPFKIPRHKMPISRKFKSSENLIRI